MQNVTHMSAGRVVTITLFGNRIPLYANKIPALLDTMSDEQAFDLLNMINPVERAWAYRAMGA